MKRKQSEFSPEVAFVQLEEKDLTEVQWLWYPYIPAKNATMIFGPGGVGKSTLMADLVARITTGRGFPNEEEHLGAERVPMRVLMLSAEDDLPSVLGPKLKRAGAALKRVYFGEEPFTLTPRNLKSIAKEIQDSTIAVIFIDPAVSYLGGKVDMNKMNEVRTITGELQRIAKAHGVTIILVHHSKKPSENTPTDANMAAGSVDFVNATRSVLYAHKSNDKRQKLLEHVKNNYGPLGDTLPYKISADGMVAWGEPIPNEESDLYEAADERPVQGGKRHDVRRWLKGFLADGPAKATEVQAAAVAAGYSISTLNRAKGAVAVSRLDRQPDGKVIWYWLLK